MIELIVTILVGTLCFFAILFDIELFRLTFTTRAKRYVRFIHWFPCALTYAFFYMSRYSLDVFTQASIFTADETSLAYTVGFWVYAFLSPFIGAYIDRFKNVKLSLLISFMMNVFIVGLIGTYVLVSKSIPVFILLYSVSFLCQSAGIASILKFTSTLYGPYEKGVFYGVFNVIISSGYYMSLSLSSSLSQSYGIDTMYFVNGGAILLCIFVLLCTRPYEYETVEASEGFLKSLTRLFDSKMYIYQLLFSATSSWVLQGLLTNLLTFLVYERSFLSNDDRSMIAGAITIGSIIGGLSSGIISDLCFNGYRRITLLVYGIGQIIFLLLLYFFSKENIIYLIIIIFFLFVFISGQTTIIGFALPATLDNDIMGLGNGMLTSSMYLSSGLGSLLATFLIPQHFFAWMTSLWVMTILGLFVAFKSMF